jgi:hypothetical protein
MEITGASIPMETHPTALGNEDSSGSYTSFLEHKAALNHFVALWRAGRLPKTGWTHAAHVATAAYIAFDHSPEVTFEQMKTGILYHNASVGTPNTDDSGYHETLTRFWCDTVGDLVRSAGFSSRLEAVRCAVQAFGGSRDLPRSYYSFDLVADRRARHEWVPPDRHPRSTP